MEPGASMAPMTSTSTVIELRRKPRAAPLFGERTDLHTLPVFPLNMVLFPDGILPLRIFEPRYLHLVSRCMREECCFVVSLITSGVETGASEFHTIGTTARIVDWDRGPDGMLHVKAVGEQIVTINHSEMEPDGLYVGEVEYRAPREPYPVPAKHRRLAELVSGYLSELQAYTPDCLRPDDAHWLADRLCELLPLSLTQRQALLELEDPIGRLDALHCVMPEAASA